MKILVVEDDFVSRAVLTQLLSSLGQTDVAINGHEAVEAVQTALRHESPYDLVCLDIMMPEMDGREALEKIRTAEDVAGLEGLERTKIVMTTALDASKDIMHAFRNECDGYLVKPIHLEAVRKLFGQLGLEAPEAWSKPAN
jgi:two-component system chemotaxis response regulator CheY